MKIPKTLLLICAAVLLSTTAHAAEKTLMHCFAWTSIKEATPADWQAFFKASDAMPHKIKGVTKVWYGKLASPLNQNAVVKIDEEGGKKLAAGATATVELKRNWRDWGMCME